MEIIAIHPDDFKRKMTLLFQWNMQPLTTEEMLSDTLHCPTCRRVRYAMWKAKYPSIFTYMGKYCICPSEKG